MVGKYFPWIILRKLLIKIRSKYPSEDDVIIITLFFGLVGGRNQLRGRAAGGREVQHDRRGSNTTHAQVCKCPTYDIVLNTKTAL